MYYTFIIFNFRYTFILINYMYYTFIIINYMCYIHFLSVSGPLVHQCDTPLHPLQHL